MSVEIKTQLFKLATVVVNLQTDGYAHVLIGKL